MSDIYVRDVYGVNRRFVDTGQVDDKGKPVHAEVISGGSGGGSSPSAGAIADAIANETLTVKPESSNPTVNGSPAAWPWQQTITDGTEYVLTWADGRGAPLTVWKGAGDTIEVAKRDGDGQDWDVLVNDNLTWSSDLVEGVVYQVRFRRTSGAGSTVVGGRG